MPATVKVTNTGDVPGSDAVQLYVSKPDTLAKTPPRELAAFAKVSLKSGQTKTVRLNVDARELSYWDSGAQAFTVQDGAYTFAAGDSSRSLPTTAGYRVTHSDGPVRLTAGPASSTVAPGDSLSGNAAVRNLSDYTDHRSRISVTAPSGWTVILAAEKERTLAPGDAQDACFQVRVPASTLGGRYEIDVHSTGIVNGRRSTSLQRLGVTVPIASLAAAYDTVGLTTNADPGPGNFDPGGYSYSSDNLAKVGIVPGQPVTVDGSTVIFPPEAPGTPDAVTTNGQVITVNAHASPRHPGRGHQRGSQGDPDRHLHRRHDPSHPARLRRVVKQRRHAQHLDRCHRRMEPTHRRYRRPQRQHLLAKRPCRRRKEHRHYHPAHHFEPAPVHHAIAEL